MNPRSRFPGWIAVGLSTLFAVYCGLGFLAVLGAVDIVVDQTPLIQRWWVRTVLDMLPANTREQILFSGGGLEWCVAMLWKPVAETSWLRTLLAIAMVASFAAWAYSANRRLRARGVPLRYASHWALTGWVVPVGNLVWPFLFTRELWQASQARAADGRPAAPILVRIWWELWLLTVALFVGISFVLPNGRYEAAGIVLVGFSVAIAMVAVLIRIIRRVETGLAAAGATPLLPVPFRGEPGRSGAERDIGMVCGVLFLTAIAYWNVSGMVGDGFQRWDRALARGRAERELGGQKPTEANSGPAAAKPAVHYVETGGPEASDTPDGASGEAPAAGLAGGIPGGVPGGVSGGSAASPAPEESPGFRPRAAGSGSAAGALPAVRATGMCNVGVVTGHGHFGGFGAYLQEVTDDIATEWESTATRGGSAPAAASQVRVSFRLTAQGRIAEVLRTDGDAGAAGTKAAIDAVWGSTPRRPWTTDMTAALGEEQVIELTFVYR